MALGMSGSSIRTLLMIGAASAIFTGCAQQRATPAVAQPDLGILWVRDSAEYRALSLQAYGAATADLQRFIDDKSWSALPHQENARELPPAIIFDVDETLVSNVMFQLELEPPFSN